MTAVAGPAGRAGDGDRDPVGRSHRSPRGRRGADALIGVLLTVLCVAWIGLTVGTPLTGRTTFLASSVLDTAAPWRAAAPNDTPIATICTTDTVDAVAPGRKLAADAARHGQVAQIDPYQVGGSSTAFSQNTGVYDPVTFVPYTTLPQRNAPAWEKVLELAVALLGMLLWMRRLGLSTTAGVVGGLVYGTSGFMVTWTDWPQTAVACWIPMLFWAAERLAQRRTLSSALLLSLPFAAMILGGFPAVTGWSAYAVAVYMAMRLLAQQRPVRALVEGGLLAGLGVTFALGISAFQLLPFAKVYGGRDFGYRAQLGLSTLDHRTVATLLFPSAFGSCGDARGVDWFLPGAYVESVMFLGTAALVLALVAVTGRLRPGVPRGPRVFMVLMAAFVLNQMLFHDPLERVAAGLPVFDNSPAGRLRCLLGVAGAVLAAMGADRLAAGAWQPRWWRSARTLPVAGVWLAAAAGVAFIAYKVHRIDDVEHVGSQLEVGIRDALLVAAGTAVVLLMGATVRRFAVPAAFVVAVVVAVQGGAYAHSFWPRTPNRDFYPTTPTQALLARDLGSYRAVGDGSALRIGTATFYGQASPVGHSFAQPGWEDLLKALDAKVAVTPTYLSLVLADGELGSPILDQMSVRYVVRSDDAVIVGTTVAPPATTGTTPLTPASPVSAAVGDVPLRGVGVTLGRTLSVAGAPYAALRVQVLDRAGTVVSSGTRRIYTDLGPGTVLEVAVTDPGTARGPYRARVSLVDDANATSLATDAGTAALTRVERPSDGLSVVLSDGAVVYRRDGALPHVRWAGSATSVAPSQQVATLSAGLPSGTVLLPAGSPGTASGRGADIADATTTATRVAADVEAAGAGYLVVANADAVGWSATVDGHRAALLDADHGMQAVPVPAGEHHVVLTYDQPGLNTGIAVTLVSLVAYAAAWLVIPLTPALVRRRRRSRVAGREDADAGRAADADEPATQP